MIVLYVVLTVLLIYDFIRRVDPKDLPRRPHLPQIDRHELLRQNELVLERTFERFRRGDLLRLEHGVGATHQVVHVIHALGQERRR